MICVIYMCEMASIGYVACWHPSISMVYQRLSLGMLVGLGLDMIKPTRNNMRYAILPLRHPSSTCVTLPDKLQHALAYTMSHPLLHRLRPLFQFGPPVECVFGQNGSVSRVVGLTDSLRYLRCCFLPQSVLMLVVQTLTPACPRVEGRWVRCSECYTWCCLARCVRWIRPMGSTHCPAKEAGRETEAAGSATLPSRT